MYPRDRTGSVRSNNSIITNDSLQSSNRSMIDPFNQLLDDLTIIDDIIPDFNDDHYDLEPHYESQVANAARNVAQKQFTVNELFQYENNHFTEMNTLLSLYLEPIIKILNDPSSNLNSNFEKNNNCSFACLFELYALVKSILNIHQDFLNGLEKRLAIWGPTQFLSDVFNGFFDRISVYDEYLKVLPSVIMTIDTLYKKSPSFLSLIERSNRGNKDLVFYLKYPITQLQHYTRFLVKVSDATDPSHPDYRSLALLTEKCSGRITQWKPIVLDRLAHIGVLESSRAIQDSPVSVTNTRRLYMSGKLTKVDSSSPHSTSDTRYYYLYNDFFIFTHKIKSKSNNSTTEKLVYKGSIAVNSFTVSPISVKSLSKFTKKTKTFGLKKSEQEQLQQQDIYGFELHVNKLATDGMSGYGEFAVYYGPSGGAALSSTKTMIMRAPNESDQSAWLFYLSKVSKQYARKK